MIGGTLHGFGTRKERRKVSCTGILKVREKSGGKYHVKRKGEVPIILD